MTCTDASFNRGCDARLAGKPFKQPHGKMDLYWRLGWMHVQRHWGEDAKGPVKPLPLARMGTEVME